MLSLLKSEKFQNEYKMYQDKINLISDDIVRKKAVTILKSLVIEIKRLDSQHQDMFSGNQIPTGLGDVRNNITTIRKNLDKLLKDQKN